MEKKIWQNESLQMFLVSLTALYVELVLIRWIGTELRVFAYVQNLSLIACFLGFGVGCLRAKKPCSPLSSLNKLTALTVIVGVVSLVSRGERALDQFSNLLTFSSDAALWGRQIHGLTDSGYIILAVAVAAIMAGLLWLIAASMVPLGQCIAACFVRSGNTIRAYTVNLLGSLVGTWLLLGLSFMETSPVLWFSIAFALILSLPSPSRENRLVKALYFIPMLASFALIGTATNELKWETFWSPYQKLQLAPFVDKTGYVIHVNNTGYMSIVNTTEKHLASRPDLAKTLADSVYDSPFRFLPRGPEVLIVGAGAGNDAAAALRNGASHVDAVEIDPMIYDLGKKLHPDRPYQSEKVDVIIDDARNFFRQSQKKYDAVIFGLLDSHTGFSGYSNMRVDNYVYTKEAFEQARLLLKPEGVLILKFEVRAPWLWMGQRFHRTLTEVFGREPIAYYTPNVGPLFYGSVFLESDGQDLWRKAETSGLKEFLDAHPLNFEPSPETAPSPATDDWPYVYHRDRTIPRTYLTVSVLLLGLSFFMAGKSFVRGGISWPPFFLGAGFLLLETQLISRLGLYFGSTWVVNSIAITTILCVLMLVNVFLELCKKPPRVIPLYALLIASLAANYFFPWETLPFAPRITGLLLSAAYAVSVFLAGIIFTTTLQKSEDKAKTLGSNVLGSVAGGLMQNVSFVMGLKVLLLLAAANYALAAFTGRKK